MQSTVDQQVPNKLRTARGLVVRKNPRGYWLPEPEHTFRPGPAGQHRQTTPEGHVGNPADGLLPLPPPQVQPPQTIRIDPEVWQALQNRAVPFVDSPNDVLRRLLGLPPS